MPKLRVHGFSISLDGYGAGPKQDPDDPLGVGGEALHTWFVATRTFQQRSGRDGVATGIDDDFAARGFTNIGAWIMGRNMFGPIRGPWPDDSWKGWWGNNPPYHAPVFVLTNHSRASVVMDGGTTFHFVTDGIHAALERATEAANGKDIQLMGGASAIRLRGTPSCRPRHPKVRLSVHRTRDHRERYARCPYKGRLSAARHLDHTPQVFIRRLVHCRGRCRRGLRGPKATCRRMLCCRLVLELALFDPGPVDPFQFHSQNRTNGPRRF